MEWTFSLKTENDLLDSIWEALQRSRSSRVESDQTLLVGIENGALGANGEVASGQLKTGAGVGSRIYIGQLYDAATSLNYLGARYENSAVGRFISEDPISLGTPTQQDLTNPQNLNIYAYGADNPILNKDPSGKGFLDEPLVIIAGLGLTAYGDITNGFDAYNYIATNYTNQGGYSTQDKYDSVGTVGYDIITAALPYDLGPLGKLALKAGTTALDLAGRVSGVNYGLQIFNTFANIPIYPGSQNYYTNPQTNQPSNSNKTTTTSNSPKPPSNNNNNPVNVATSGTPAQNQQYNQLEQQIAQIQTEINSLKR